MSDARRVANPRHRRDAGPGWGGMVAAGLLAALTPLGPALADDATVAAGREIVAHGVSPERPGCASCHLQDGAGQPDAGIPRIAGLTSSYVDAQLGYFASDARHDTAMTPYARMLTAAQRQDVADYFASLPMPSKPDMPPSAPAQLARGQALFLDGDYHTGMPSCSQCHGTTGLGVGDFSPRLAGQSAVYVAEKLQQWHTGELRDPKGAFMRAEAGHLDQSSIDAVAAYVASLGNGEGSKP